MRTPRTRLLAIGGPFLVLALMLMALAACGGTTQSRAAPTSTLAQPTASPTPTLPHWVAVRSVPTQTMSFAFAPSAPRIAYLCANDGPAAVPLPATSRLYSSADGGQSWELIANTPRLSPIQDGGLVPAALCAVFVDANDPRDVFFQQTELDPEGAGQAIQRALFRSRDGGATWQTLSVPDHTNGFDTLIVLGSRLVARDEPIVTGGGTCESGGKPTLQSTVVASDDGGTTWHDLGGPMESQGYFPQYVAAAGNALVLDALQTPGNTCQHPITSGLWRSTDRGATWTQLPTPALEIFTLRFTPKAVGSGYYGVAWAYPPANPSDITPLYSSDSGASWSALPAIARFDTIDQLIVCPSGAVLADDVTASGMLILRPGDAGPAWLVYTADLGPESGGTWQVVAGAGNGTVWTVQLGDNAQANLAHLALP